MGEIYLYRPTPRAAIPTATFWPSLLQQP